MFRFFPRADPIIQFRASGTIVPFRSLITERLVQDAPAIIILIGVITALLLEYR